MSQVGARPRWRDGLVLAVLAAVIIGGLVHYGRSLRSDEGGGQAARTSGSRTGGASPSPSDEATAELDGAPPADPNTPPSPAGGTCWDGRETSALRLCGLPEGARGLAWVFPSFGRDRALCHRAEPNADSYPVAESYECFQRAFGQAVTVTYDLVKDPAQVERWLEARIGRAHRTLIPGAHGGRAIFTDAVSRPARITGTYLRFPYVVSVYADTPRAATDAWRSLVKQRPTQTIRGVPNV